MVQLPGKCCCDVADVHGHLFFALFRDPAVRFHRTFIRMIELLCARIIPYNVVIDSRIAYSAIKDRTPLLLIRAAPEPFSEVSQHQFKKKRMRGILITSSGKI
jgi:hypothetical protein